MNICNWEAIHGFDSPGEYRRFCAWIESQTQSLMAEEVPVRKLQSTIPFGFEEKWYRCNGSGDVWRLVAPEFPFRGLWDLVDDYCDVSNENRSSEPESNHFVDTEKANLSVTFHHIEKQIGINFATEFHQFIDQFDKETKRSSFSNFFRKSHFCREGEMRTAINSFVPDGYIPFFVDEHDGFDDYYCFEEKNSENSQRILVFSQDAIVFEWGSYVDFLVWVQNKIDSK